MKKYYVRKFFWTLSIMFLINFNAYADSINFETVMTIPISSKPIAISSADFDGDGNLDFAVVSNSKIIDVHTQWKKGIGSLSIYKGDGTGKFKKIRRYKTGINSIDMCIGDFNGDTMPDIAVANMGYLGGVKSDPSGESGKMKFKNLSVFLGRRNVNKISFKKKTIKSVNWPLKVAASDLDNDGKDELIAFDNKTDLILRAGDKRVHGFRLTIFKYDNSSFSKKKLKPSYAGEFDEYFNSLNMVVDDYNNDGYKDIITFFYHTHTPILYYANQYDKKKKISFDKGIVLKDQLYSPSAVMATAGDYNQDGFLDVAIVGDISEGFGTVMYGATNNIFSYSFYLQDYWNDWWNIYVYGKEFPMKMYSADLNGDGFLDLAIPTPFLMQNCLEAEQCNEKVIAENVITVILGDGAGSFAEPVTFQTGNTPIAVAGGDFDNNGKIDLASLNNESNSITILLNQ